jgi:hypothetical protein
MAKKSGENMDISSITSTPNYMTTPASTAKTASPADINNAKTASIIGAIADAASVQDPIAMLSALKQIGGSGSANIPGLVNFAQMRTTANIDASVIASIGNSGSGNINIYSALQSKTASMGNLAYYAEQRAQKSSSSVADSSDILDSLIHQVPLAASQPDPNSIPTS